ncbi:MAG TPA: EamA family transporter [Bryobacteraceae bacterium]|nr:EamA family transporter [Bryobacteraceae bacterium]
MKWLLLLLMIAATITSDVLQSYEMKRAGAQSVGARGLLRIVKLIAARRFLLLAVACMAVSFFSFMALVETQPLSFAVPASAASFIFETLLAKFVLKEYIGPRRAIGTVIVMFGVILLGGS